MPRSKRWPPRSSPKSANAPAACCGPEGHLAEAGSCSRFLLEHDLCGKPVPTFPDHALTLLAHNARRALVSPWCGFVTRHAALGLGGFCFVLRLGFAFRSGGGGRFHPGEAVPHRGRGALG